MLVPPVADVTSLWSSDDIKGPEVTVLPAQISVFRLSCRSLMVSLYSQNVVLLTSIKGSGV